MAITLQLSTRPAALPAATRRISDLLCASHRAEILGSMSWPAGLVPGRESVCRGCRYVSMAALEGWYVVFNEHEHDLRRGSAYHEAGHAVVGVVVGNTIDLAEVSAEIPPIESVYPGRVRYWPGADVARHGKFGEAVSTWAGTVAHRAWLRSIGMLTVANEIGCASSSLADTIWISANVTTDESTDALDQARLLVAAYADDIDRVAEALLIEDLNHDDVRSLIHTPIAGTH